MYVHFILSCGRVIPRTHQVQHYDWVTYWVNSLKSIGCPTRSHKYEHNPTKVDGVVKFLKHHQQAPVQISTHNISATRHTALSQSSIFATKQSQIQAGACWWVLLKIDTAVYACPNIFTSQHSRRNVFMCSRENCFNILFHSLTNLNLVKTFLSLAVRSLPLI